MPSLSVAGIWGSWTSPTFTSHSESLALQSWALCKPPAQADAAVDMNTIGTMERKPATSGWLACFHPSHRAPSIPWTLSNTASADRLHPSEEWLAALWHLAGLLYPSPGSVRVSPTDGHNQSMQAVTTCWAHQLLGFLERISSTTFQSYVFLYMLIILTR